MFVHVIDGCVHDLGVGHVSMSLLDRSVASGLIKHHNEMGDGGDILEV